MHDYCILTPTFNRAEKLTEIIGALQQEAGKHSFSVVHCIVDDGSDWRFHLYKDMVKSLTRDNYKFVLERNFKNFGRPGFWKTWNKLMAMAKGREWENAIAIPDDHLPCGDFLSRVRKHFDSLRRKDDKAVAMNILVQSKRNWQRNRFVDGAFICRREFFKCLNWKMNPVDPAWYRGPDDQKRHKQVAPASSGVGKQMTDRLARHQKWRISRVRNVSFLLPMRAPSVMFPPDVFPKRPAKWGLGSANFIDNPDRQPAF